MIAERVLKDGSDLFDAKNAEGLAATYTENGEIHLLDKRENEYRDDVIRGRPEIERFYRGGFKDARVIDSENRVEFARFVSPDVLVIHGRFRPNVGEDELSFVQMRVMRDDRWQLRTLWLFTPSQPR